jgi:hypothetical protein
VWTRITDQAPPKGSGEPGWRHAARYRIALRSFPIPTCCAPCPEKSSAIFSAYADHEGSDCVRQTRHRGSTIAEISFHPNLAHLSQSILTGSNLAIEGDRFRASEIICQSLLSWHCWRCSIRRDGRVVDCTGLENRRSARVRGFESHSLRHIDFRQLNGSARSCRTSGDLSRHESWTPQEAVLPLRYSVAKRPGAYAHQDRVRDQTGSPPSKPWRAP